MRKLQDKPYAMELDAINKRKRDIEGDLELLCAWRSEFGIPDREYAEKIKRLRCQLVAITAQRTIIWNKRIQFDVPIRR